MTDGTLDAGSDRTLTLDYLTGFGNEHATESEPGVLPKRGNSPQRVTGDLYAEQISGTAFTASRADTRRTWLYRRRPSVRHVTGLSEVDPGPIRTAPHGECTAPISQLRWSPVPIDEGADTTWLSGLSTVAANGDAHLQRGGATHLYHATRSMEGEVFVNADGELLILPEIGELRLVTEMGVLEAR